MNKIKDILRLSCPQCLTRIFRIKQQCPHGIPDSTKAGDKQTFLPLVSVIVRVTLDLPFKSIMETRKLFVDLVLFFLLLHLQTSDNKRINSKAIWKRERGGKCKCCVIFNICSNCIFSSIQHRPVLQLSVQCQLE